MHGDILIISDDLVEPPSEILPFRTITMMCHDNLHMDVLLHSTQEMKDMYYNWMKVRGMMDYIKYILSEWEYEEGIHLDTIGVYPNSIVTKHIRIENQVSILGQIKALSKK